VWYAEIDSVCSEYLVVDDGYYFCLDLLTKDMDIAAKSVHVALVKVCAAADFFRLWVLFDCLACFVCRSV